jgi:hypothetical protein
MVGNQSTQSPRRIGANLTLVLVYRPADLLLPALPRESIPPAAGALEHRLVLTGVPMALQDYLSTMPF